MNKKENGVNYCRKSSLQVEYPTWEKSSVLGLSIMEWNSKQEIIALLILLGGIPLVAVIAGVVTPAIINIKQGDFNGIITIVVSLTLICCAIYLLRCRNQKNKKSEDEQKQ